MYSRIVRNQIGFAIVIALATPIVAQAECVTIPIPKGERHTVTTPGLAFSGTVTATDINKLTVSFNVDRVWHGELRRDATMFVNPVLEGARVTAFQIGETYLVVAYQPVYVFTAEELTGTGLGVGTFGVSFGCGDGPLRLADATSWLTQLGRGREPRP